jgi:hypothetical protein
MRWEIHAALAALVADWSKRSAAAAEPCLTNLERERDRESARAALPARRVPEAGPAMSSRIAGLAPGLTPRVEGMPAHDPAVAQYRERERTGADTGWGRVVHHHPMLNLWPSTLSSGGPCDRATAGRRPSWRRRDSQDRMDHRFRDIVTAGGYSMVNRKSWPRPDRHRTRSPMVQASKVPASTAQAAMPRAPMMERFEPVHDRLVGAATGSHRP